MHKLTLAAAVHKQVLEARGRHHSGGVGRGRGGKGGGKQRGREEEVNMAILGEGICMSSNLPAHPWTVLENQQDLGGKALPDASAV